MMKSGVVTMLLCAVCLVFAAAAVAQIFNDGLAYKVWDDYINRYIRLADTYGVPAAAKRNREIQDLIAQQNAFPSWAELTTQAVKDLGAEKWNQITKEKMAELKAKVERLQTGKAPE